MNVVAAEGAETNEAGHERDDLATRQAGETDNLIQGERRTLVRGERSLLVQRLLPLHDGKELVDGGIVGEHRALGLAGLPPEGKMNG